MVSSILILIFLKIGLLRIKLIIQSLCKVVTIYKDRSDAFIIFILTSVFCCCSSVMQVMHILGIGKTYNVCPYANLPLRHHSRVQVKTSFKLMGTLVLLGLTYRIKFKPPLQAHEKFHVMLDSEDRKGFLIQRQRPQHKNHKEDAHE